MRTTKIEWTEKTWNPVTGCTKISAGCRHYYAEVMARRLYGMGNSKYRNGFVPTPHENVLKEPLHWEKPSKEDAKRIVKENCGMRFGEIQADVPDVMDWEFDMKPIETVR